MAEHQLLGFKRKQASVYQSGVIIMNWVTCSCGWSSMVRWRGSAADAVLRTRWENHAYTKEERALLNELAGRPDWWW